MTIGQVAFAACALNSLAKEPNMAAYTVFLRACGLASACVLLAAGCEDRVARRAAIETADSQVRRIAAELDQHTTETGVYVRANPDAIRENDPWGTPITFGYSQGGVAELVTVRSAGPDREFQTKDDVVASGLATNFKGVGDGIKRNAEETAARTAKGLVRGTVEGLRQSFRNPD